MSDTKQSLPDTTSKSRRAFGFVLGAILGVVVLLAALWLFGFLGKKSPRAHHADEDDGISFVHATDPHLFLKAVQADGKTPDEIKKEQGKIHRQEELNEKALTDMLKHVRSLPSCEGPSAFLVMAGDLGIDPCEICKTAGKPGKRTLAECLDADPAEQIEKIARILGDSPVPNIYLVAGNNDIANESAGDEALKYFNDLIDAVQAKLDPGKVKLHNLTRGYLSSESPEKCYADIPHTDYRLIGFPSYSFKTEDPGQERHMKIFRGLVEDAGKAGKKVLVVSHTPAMDDPYNLAQARYNSPAPTPAATATAAATPKKTAATPETIADTENKAPFVSTWKVNKNVLDGWKEMVNSDSVAAVLAGHLHDSHKEIYRPPYSWSNGSEHRPAFQKLFLAPPLAVKNQDRSPIQARGFALVHLQGDRVESRLFWYDSETGKFTPDPKHKHRWERHGGFWRCLCDGSRAAVGWMCGAIGWLWDLEKTDSALVRMAVLLIALLTAFLTIVAIWQIPPGSDPFAEEKKAAQGESKPAPSTAAADLPFSNRFGKTVIAGLAGLVAAEVTKTLGNEKPSTDTRWYYIIWFILFFFLLLLSLNLWRAAVEALRARVAVVYYPLARRGPAAETPWESFIDGVGYWLIRRPWQWVASLRVPLLTFSDTFINLIQGKNQTRTEVFEKRIIDQQRNVVRVASAIRVNLNYLIETQVRRGRQEASKATGDFKEVQPSSVRVNISVLSKDQTSVFYISRARGSSQQAFPKHSVAWASVFTGEPLWYLSEYRQDLVAFEKIILFQPSPIPDENGPILLRDYYQPRAQEDYQAFIILPVPSPRREFGSDYVKGAIQFSFRDASDIKFIWKTEDMKPKGDPAIYPTPQRVLEEWCQDPGVRAVLTNSVAALGELLRGFNEIIYKNYIESNQTD